MTFFDRLRRSSLLRALLVVAALVAIQSSLACTFAEVDSAQATETESRTDTTSAGNGPGTSRESGDQCNVQCLNCMQCGCHSSAAIVRADDVLPGFAPVIYADISPETAVPEPWTPPTPLRPPINAA